MAKLIDVEGVLCDKVWFCGGFVSDDFSMGYMEALDKVETVIRQAPIVDAVPVVRCQDCKFIHDKGFCTRVAGLTRIKLDDFCSRGERRTDG